MIKRGTIILFVVMLLMIAAFMILNKKDLLSFLTQPQEPTATPLPIFISIDAGNIDSMSFLEKGKTEINISKDENSEWQLYSEQGKFLFGNIEQIVSEINAIKASVSLSIDLEQEIYGINDPIYTFTFNLSDGSKKQIKIGFENPTKSGYYAQVDASTIFLIPKGGIENILDIIANIQISTTPTPVITKTPEN